MQYLKFAAEHGRNLSSIDDSIEQNCDDHEIDSIMALKFALGRAIKESSNLNIHLANLLATPDALFSTIKLKEDLVQRYVDTLKKIIQLQHLILVEIAEIKQSETK